LEIHSSPTQEDVGLVFVDGCCGRQGMDGTIERLEASLGGEDVHGTWLNPLPRTP